MFRWGRVNFHFEGSQHEKKTVVFRLHPNGGGYIYGGLLRGYETDDKGFVSIRDMDEAQLRELTAASIASLSVAPRGFQQAAGPEPGGQEAPHDQRPLDRSRGLLSGA